MKSGRLYKLYLLYQRALSRRPFLVDAVQTGLLMGVGDLTSQTLIEKQPLKNINIKRTISFASVGFFLAGPVLRLWFGMLHKHLGVDKDRSGKSVVMKKVFFDQVIFAPIYLYVLLIAIGISQGKSWNVAKSDVENKIVDVLQLNYCIWPAVQFLNFYYIPIEYQVLVGSTVALAWDTYLSWKMNRSKE